jgi:hypothetical protein
MSDFGLFYLYCVQTELEITSPSRECILFDFPEAHISNDVL